MSCDNNTSLSSSSSSLASSPSVCCYDLTLVSPWFELTAENRKRYEGRLNKATVTHFKPNQFIRIKHANETKRKYIIRRVVSVHSYPSFLSGLSVLPLSEVLPDVPSILAGVEIYRNFYSDEL